MKSDDFFYMISKDDKKHSNLLATLYTAPKCINLRDKTKSEVVAHHFKANWDKELKKAGFDSLFIVS